MADGNLPFSTVLTVTTAAKSGSSNPGHPDSQSGGATFWEELSGFGLFGMFLVGGTRKNRRQTGIVLGILMVLMVLALAGCGSSHSGTPVGSHTITVTATGTGANAPTQSMNLTLVVQ